MKRAHEKINKKKKAKVFSFCKIFCLIFASISICSGSLLIFNSIHYSLKTNFVTISDESDRKIIGFNSQIVPGESKEYNLRIKSNIKTNINYQIKFENSNQDKIEKYFYVSASIDNKSILNNTLDEILEFDSAIGNRILYAKKTEVINFVFSINPIVDFEYDLSFNIVIEAKGRLINYGK